MKETDIGKKRCEVSNLNIRSEDSEVGRNEPPKDHLIWQNNASLCSSVFLLRNIIFWGTLNIYFSEMPKLILLKLEPFTFRILVR